MKQRLFILIIILSSGLLSAASFNKALADSLFNVLQNKNKAMCSIALVKGDQLVYSRAIGFCEKTDKTIIPANTTTKYRIGSISKMFTSAIIFQLIEEKKLTLDSTLDKYFPQIPNAGKITVRQLLSHRSGIHNFTDDPEYPKWMEQAKSHEEIVKLISSYKPDFEPDTQASYSNSNFILLGYIIETIDKKPFAKVLSKRITDKLKLKDTFYGAKINPAKNQAFSYTYQRDWIKSTETDMSVPGGAGAVVSTPTDLGRYITALFDGKIISKSSLDSMTVIRDGYGRGIFPIPYGEKKAYGHSGGIDGFASVLIYCPEDSLAIAFCSNGLNYSQTALISGVLDIYYKKDYQIPSFIEYAVAPELLDKYAGKYSCEQLQMEINVFKDQGQLSAQATGQSAFPLTAGCEHEFQFEAAGIIMIFDPAGGKFTLKQSGGEFIFLKK